MVRIGILASFAAGAAALGLVLITPHSAAQRNIAVLETDDAEAELERATRESQRAEARAERFAREAEMATEAAERTAREAAALAAHIQRAEANIAVARARFTLAQRDRAALSARLAERQQPLARLTGALQTTARRPLALSALQPGSLKDLVYVRAVLDSAVPQIRQRTAALRSELERGRMLERRAVSALESVTVSEADLRDRRKQLAELETRQRLVSRAARGNAVREEERALALAEEARDLDGLVDKLDEIAALRRELAALPGPVLRPEGLGQGVTSLPRTQASPASAMPPPLTNSNGARTSGTRPPADFQLPVSGRAVTGFGAIRESGLRSTGLTLAPASSAQVVAPGSGRVAFAAPYRGFERIVIIEHAGGWTSLVTGLARADVAVGDEVIGGSPIGIAAAGNSAVTIELRYEGEPVNPLQFLR